MGRSWLLILIFLVASGCAWTPERDNPVDPLSPYHISPLPPNRPPQVGQVRAVTHIQISSDDFHSMEISCNVTDPDLNLRYDLVSAVIEDIALGYMSYDGQIGLFFLRISENDLDVRWRDDLDGDTIWVTAVDDSGATARGWAVYNVPARNPPIVRRPDNYEWVSLQPVLSWYAWGSPNDGHTYSVRVILYERTMWDTTGIPANVDSVKVTRTLPSTQEDSSRRYQWYLTVTEQNGDSRTSQPGLFLCKEPDTLATHSFEAYNPEYWK
ncbi:hypothetical protein KKH27_14220 [bacterium]|nr:hypothetical protein [bacterium]MBU1984318.1 hypothetical protein [bacterium]